jgi:gas vesicle protein
MNKILIGAIATMTLVPAMIFASNDSWNTSRSDIDHMKRMNYSGSTASGMVRPPVGTGAMIALELKVLHEAGEKLTLEQRIELAKIIRAYIESKGIQVPTLPQVKEVRQEIKEVRKQTQEEIKKMREKTREELKNKREELKNNIKNKNRAGTATGIVITGTVSV